MDKGPFVDVICQYCNQPAKFVTGREVFPHREDLFKRKFWQCVPCEAHVGCHTRGKGYKGNEALGILAKKDLRKAKIAAHAAFDPLWKIDGFNRTSAYKWLADQMNMPTENCHIGMMSVEECNRVVSICMLFRLEQSTQTKDK